MAIIDGIAPSVIVVEVCRVIDRPVVKIEVGIPVPWFPAISRCVALNDTHLRLPLIGRYLNIFDINLLAAFRDDVEFHPPVFHVSCCWDFDVFGAVLRAEHEGISVACFLSVFVVVAAARQFAFGIANPDAAGNRFIVVFNFELPWFAPVSH